VDRLDSNFDSSYEPATEELLYEGDPETETKQDSSALAGDGAEPGDVREDGEGEADLSAAERREEEEGFMVEVHYEDQGGSSLEDPVATVIGPAHSTRDDLEEKGGKPSGGAAGGKTAGDSTRFVLPCRFPSISLHSIVVLIGAHHHIVTVVF
jgi:hypothetical protein